MGIHSLPARRWGQIGLVALLGLTLALVTVSAGRADSSIWHKGGATTAKKKKCKKKGKKSAAASKKKKCKHKKKVAPPAPVVTPPKSPIERIVLTWTGDADLDVHAWSNGLHDGWNETLDGGMGAYEVQIPGTTYQHSGSGDVGERIVETNPNPSVPMTFGICNYPIGLTPNDADLTVTSVLANGTSETDSFTLDYDDYITDGVDEGGTPPPRDDWCPLVP